MKIFREPLFPHSPGSIIMVPEEADDLWLAYNLIAEGDIVTFWKFQREAATFWKWKDRRERVVMELEIVAEDVYFDKEAGSVLRISGRSKENKLVKRGEFHTVEIELHRPFRLRKEAWDTLSLDVVVRQASDPRAGSGADDVAVALMQEGLAQIFRISKSITKTCSRIQVPIPPKHDGPCVGHDKALDSFFKNVLAAFLKHIDFKAVRCVVIASPDSTRDQFHRYLMSQADRRKQLRPVFEDNSRIILVHTTSGSTAHNGLREVLGASNVTNTIEDTKAAKEVRALNDLFAVLSSDPARACCGLKHVEIAYRRGAIQTLLITDELLRSSDAVMRKEYIYLINSMKYAGGTVLVFSSMHVCAEKLAQLNGIAAILRYPLSLDVEDNEMYLKN